jgi:hypothetical protein
MAINHQKLADEYRLDPRGYGYAEDIANGNDGGLMTRGNVVRDGTNLPTNPTAVDGDPTGRITVRRATVTRAEILNVIDVRDLTNIPQGINPNLAAAWMESLLQADQIPLTDPDGTVNLIRRNLNRMIGNTNFSQERLDALAMEVGSRNRELFGQNVTLNDVSTARSLLPTV